MMPHPTPQYGQTLLTVRSVIGVQLTPAGLLAHETRLTT
jgi:hypothetical protein